MTTKNKTAGTVATTTKSNLGRLINLVIGDALVFLIFAALGRRSHGEAAGLDALLQIALTALPFALAWFVVAPFLKVYRRDVDTDPLRMVKRTLLAWVCAWPVALILRSVFVDHAIVPLTFALISLLANALLLLIWRWPFSLMQRMRQKEGR
ncbi:DUF3054 domain-containing protein [Ktedonosporobacter rubrisoli]|uniref:DUF3054 domain-containing protein n=1 Tax=Ktedonosporobacter rubrisoli TaxID=2509675 RepID=A0A4P6JZB0_KTERU|nr:DUF3054 domain-containing protein [Ktedonosporobacter rubrisoli]QBD81228.1 DUF3054 domain-containing protein [Ktedonosporobacter rubrisoli]